MSALHAAVWGAGERVVLVHGSLIAGEECFAAQRPLAAEGYCLLAIDRRGFGGSPDVAEVDFDVDARDVVELLQDGAHLVGFSYGGVVTLLAAAAAPERIRSLALLEPSALALVRGDPAVERCIAAVLEHRRAAPVEPPERPFWEAEIPVGPLRAASFGKLVLSGSWELEDPAHRREIGEGMLAAATAVADAIGAQRLVVAGAGHLLHLQQPGEVNAALLRLWRYSAAAGAVGS
jgi:pimeloyl-ACP methyl ester carboxylesterase